MKRPFKGSGRDVNKGSSQGGSWLTIQVVVFLTLCVGQSKSSFSSGCKDPLDGLDEVRLQGGRVLLLWVLGI